MQLEKITIKISDDKVLELTVEQAKELKQLLDDTFEIKKINFGYPVIYRETPWWNPIVTYTTSDALLASSIEVTNTSGYCATFELKK